MMRYWHSYTHSTITILTEQELTAIELDLKNQAAENKNRELELKLQSQEQIINSLIERLEKLEAKN